MLDKYDLVLSHVEAPDEASHQADWKTKVAAIEPIDKHVVGPVLEKLQTFPSGGCSSCRTTRPTSPRASTATPRRSFAMAGTGVQASRPAPYSEKNAAASGLKIEHGHELMEYFLRGEICERGDGRQSFHSPTVATADHHVSVPAAGSVRSDVAAASSVEKGEVRADAELDHYGRDPARHRGSAGSAYVPTTPSPRMRILIPPTNLWLTIGPSFAAAGFVLILVIAGIGLIRVSDRAAKIRRQVPLILGITMAALVLGGYVALGMIASPPFPLSYRLAR